MKKAIAISIIGAISFTILIWSSNKIDSNSFVLLRTHLQLPAKFYRRPKLLCWVLTVDLPANFDKRKAVLDTWGPRCDKLLIVTNRTVVYHQTVNKTKNNKRELLKALNGVLRIPLERDGRDQLWHKVVAAFLYIHKNYLHHYDWFMKADDDTYVFVDNLKRFLRSQEPDDPIYYGRRFKPYVKQGYMSGGSGYVLSRRALQLLVDEGFSKNISQCHLADGRVEDMEMGFCLEAVGVKAGDTRDPTGKPTFLPISPVDLVGNFEIDEDFWYNHYDFYGRQMPGNGCCSNEPISFHYIDPNMMYFIDYIVYQIRRY